MKIEPGIYEHYRGNQYEVIGVARHSETLEDMVVYRALYGDNEIWVRPASMFFEVVNVNGLERPRFRYLSKHATSTDSSQIKMKRGEDYIGVNCVFICHDEKGRVLLNKRSNTCRDERGCWDCGAGSMEFGETFEETVRREVREEYGVEPDDVRLACVKNVLRDNEGKKTHWVAAIHLVKIKNPDSVQNGEPEKIVEMGWFYPNEFPEPRHSKLDAHFGDVKNCLLS